LKIIVSPLLAAYICKYSACYGADKGNELKTEILTVKAAIQPDFPIL
jgi:hypothetical protein